ncbi:uncharacterized protein LOC128712910 [Anopheles marshallii]|uniref:uncharacterized protein LOC128712910 n=1 Tax=Anopheles marshallii TaxID=1521116 RepID=UPI00237ACA34|nr:uncharacterized protein LOC128712910 [Anopheles marshallii]
MKNSLLIALFVAATLSTAMASPRRARMAKSEHPTTIAEEVSAIDPETVSPSTELSVHPVEEVPEDKESESPKDLQEQKNDADPTVSNADDHDVAEAVVTDGEDETVPNPPADTAPALEQGEPDVAEDNQQHKRLETNEKGSKSLLNLFLNGLDDIKTAINELQTGVQTFFIPTNVEASVADAIVQQFVHSGGKRHNKRFLSH